MQEQPQQILLLWLLTVLWAPPFSGAFSSLGACYQQVFDFFLVAEDLANLIGDHLGAGLQSLIGTLALHSLRKGSRVDGHALIRHLQAWVEGGAGTSAKYIHGELQISFLSVS